MKINDVIGYAREIAPFELAEEWDNVGLLVGDKNGDVDRVLLALDITAEVVEEAREKGADMIISHHPVIFEPLKALEPDTAPYLLAKYDIAALCLHTNLDRAERGVNFALAKALGLKNTEFYPDDYIMIGKPAVSRDALNFAAFVRNSLGAPAVRYTDGNITRVAVSSGGGGDGIELNKKYGFDAFVTGELKHHRFLYAVENGIAAFEVGHFCSENVVIEPLKAMLKTKFPDISFFVSESCVCPYNNI